ncbi:MAG TPA: hypothetical protein VH482_06670 [Thermomicrobiales bacterium]
MDGSRFDALAKALAASGSRRGVVAGLAAGALGLVGVGRAEAVACRMPGGLCREHADCCSGLCGPKDATGRRRCACRAVGDCPPPAVCRAVACQGGACVGSVLPDGTACTASGGTAGTCRAGACVLPTGAACVADAQCQSGDCINGACGSFCPAGSRLGAICGAGFGFACQCRATAEGQQLACIGVAACDVQSCTSSSTCPVGTLCDGSGCFPLCGVSPTASCA